MSGAYNHKSIRDGLRATRAAKEQMPGSADGLRAMFARRWNFGQPEELSFVLLRENEDWHSAVKGDGGSFSPPRESDPDTVFAAPGETLAGFRARVDALLRQHNLD